MSEWAIEREWRKGLEVVTGRYGRCSSTQVAEDEVGNGGREWQIDEEMREVSVTLSDARGQRSTGGDGASVGHGEG